jgi:hypothetical protein
MKLYVTWSNGDKDKYDINEDFGKRMIKDMLSETGWPSQNFLVVHHNDRTLQIYFKHVRELTVRN